MQGARFDREEARVRMIGVQPFGSLSAGWTTHSWDFSGKGSTRAEDAQETPTQSHIYYQVYLCTTVKTPSFSPKKFASGGGRGPAEMKREVRLEVAEAPEVNYIETIASCSGRKFQWTNSVHLFAHYNIRGAFLGPANNPPKRGFPRSWEGCREHPPFSFKLKFGN